MTLDEILDMVGAMVDVQPPKAPDEFTRKEFASKHGLSRWQARMMLDKLVDEGKLASRKVMNELYYRIVENNNNG